MPLEQVIGFVWVSIGIVFNSYIISSITTIMTKTDLSKAK